MTRSKPAHILSALALVVALGAGLAATPARADDAPAASPVKAHKHAPHKMKAFADLDANKDGFISLAEYQAAMANTPMAKRAALSYARMDKSKDGKVTKAEYDAFVAETMARLNGHPHMGSGSK